MASFQEQWLKPYNRTALKKKPILPWLACLTDAHSALKLNLVATLQSWTMLPQPSPAKCFPYRPTFLKLLTSKSKSYVSGSGGAQVICVCVRCGCWGTQFSGVIFTIQGSRGSKFPKYNRMLFKMCWTTWKEMTVFVFLVNTCILLFCIFDIT